MPSHPSALPPIAALRAEPGVMWPYVAGRETRWRYNTATTPPPIGARGGFDFYGHADHRAWIWLRPTSRPPSRRTRRIHSGSRPARCSSSGVPAR